MIYSFLVKFEQYLLTVFAGLNDNATDDCILVSTSVSSARGPPHFVSASLLLSYCQGYNIYIIICNHKKDFNCI